MNTQQKPVILWDFDGTLFDTVSQKLMLVQQLETIIPNPDILWMMEKALRDQPHHIVATIHQFCIKHDLIDKADDIQNIFVNQEFKRFVYPEAVAALEKLKENSTPCIFTQGDVSYQQIKIHGAGLANQFEFFYVSKDKISLIPEIVGFFADRPIWYVDNQHKYLARAVEQDKTIRTVWINRYEDQASSDFQPDYILPNLTNLPEIVTS